MLSSHQLEVTDVNRSIPRLLSAAGIGAAAATTAILAIGASASSGHRSTRDGALPTTASVSHSTANLSASDVYKRDSAGVVAIAAQTQQGADSGTGIVVNSNGVILTNDHVVSGATSVTVAPGNSPNNTRTASVVGEDPDHDLAVLKVDPSGLGLKPLTFADSGSVSVGQAVYAIGNPYGLDETLTRGIVSAVGRQISAPDGATINDAIQTDAALNPGNSGGPLIDAHGNVIGVNSQIASEQASSGGQPGSTGVGFAISSNTATQIVQQIESSGASIPSTQGQGGSGQSQQTSPYGGQGTDPSQGVSPSQGVDPYGNGSQGGTDPYGSGAQDPYGYGSQGGTDPYGSGSGSIVIP
jgi:putative serine protease PepD